MLQDSEIADPEISKEVEPEITESETSKELESEIFVDTNSTTNDDVNSTKIQEKTEDPENEFGKNPFL